MDRIEEFDQALSLVVGLIDSRDLEPKRSRSDWATMRARVEEATSALEQKLLRPLNETLSFASEDDRERLRQIVASVTGAVAALLAASGDRAGASSLMARAAIVADGCEVRAELQAGATDLGAWSDLSLARWLRRNGHERKADALFAALAKNCSQPTLRQAAADALAALRPIKRAPALFSLNGFGVILYGKRDPAPNGSHVATTYLTALFVPVFPLSSYRVIPEDGGRYLFLGKVPLSRPQQFFRGALVALALASLGGLGVQSYLESPTRLADIALEQARDLDRTGQADQAFAAYDQLLRDFASRIDGVSLQPAAEAWVRLRVAEVHEPFTAAQVDEAERLVRRFEQLPLDARRGAAAGLLAGRLRDWAGQLPRDAIADLEAGARLLDLAVEACPRDQRQALTGERDALRLQIAGKLAQDWPLLALEHYGRLGGSPAGLEGSAAVLATFESESLVAEARDEANAWIRRVEADPKHQPLVARLKEKLERADQVLNGQGRKELLESTDRKLLEAELKQWPGDQEIATALAQLLRAEGDLAGAKALLDAFGGPGRLVPRALSLLASLELEAGQVVEAEVLLERLLAHKMPKFQAAQRTYETKVKEKQEQLIKQAEAGHLPADLNSRLNELPEEGAREAFFEWMSQKLTADQELTRLRQQYERHEEVVPAALSLGTIKLRRSSTAEGEERQKLLADAERTFLSIRQQAEGSPTFHLGLGQVFHRLGKGEEGDQELGALLSGSDYGLHLAVSEAYRELGLLARAMEIAEKVVAEGDAKLRSAAALSLAIIAPTLEEKEKWLAKADQADPQVRVTLAETRGHRFLGQGKLADADREYSKALEVYERDAAHNSASANNAALVLLGRFDCTRNPAHLERATKLMEAALRMKPDNSIIVGNLASMLQRLGHLATLDRRIQTRQLALAPNEAERILQLSLQGPRAETLAAELRASPHLRRSLELHRQQQVLAPNLPNGYEAELDWMVLLRDQAGLAALARRIAAVPSFDTGAGEVRRREWEDGKSDERARAALEARLSRLDQAIKRLEKQPHAPTLASALVLKADALLQLAELGRDAQQAALAIADLRKAAVIFPESNAKRMLASALFDQAILDVARDSAELREALIKEGRIIGASLAAHRAAEASPAVRAALEQHPGIREAGELLASSGERTKFGLGDWIAANLAGRAEVAERIARQLTSEQRRTEWSLRERLSPLPDWEKAMRELLERMKPTTAER
jgi:hypothetical protein